MSTSAKGTRGSPVPRQPPEWALTAQRHPIGNRRWRGIPSPMLFATHTTLSPYLAVPLVVVALAINFSVRRRKRQ